MAGEFKGDFTRDTFYAHRHYCSVFQQQGRVSLDADGNEQATILLDLLRSVSKDVIADGDVGPNKQFNLVQITPPAGSTDRDFGIMPGRVFVDGIQAILNGTKNPFSIPSTAGNKVQVSRWLVDGVPYQQGQWVLPVSVDPANPTDVPFASTPTQINSADANSRTITLNSAPTPPASSIQNGYRLIRIPTFLHQPDYVPTDDELKALKNLSSDGKLLVYLDVWERHVSFVQNPWIRELALGGPDTCVRSQLLAQIKIAADLDMLPLIRGSGGTTSIPVFKSALEDQYQPYNRGWLRARLKPVDTSNPDPCMCHPDARYRGAENQLYRVEIHFPGQAPSSTTATTVDVAPAAAAGGSSSTPTFKWSRNNGSDVYPVISVTGAEVLLDSVGRDVRSTLKSGDWVELLDDVIILQGKPGQLLQVSEVSAQDRRVTLVAASPVQFAAKDPNHPHPLLRRWDQKDPATGGTSSGLPMTEAATPQTDPWIDLEDGIQIQLIPALSPNLPDNPGSDNFTVPVNKYRTGDYWLIPARTALQGRIEWPATADNPPVPIALSPHGIDHHYLPIGAIGVSGNQIAFGNSPLKEIVPIT
jgi:hypothetical protein